MWLLTALSLCAAAQAQPAATVPSRITEVRLYPGAATVQRVARVAAGARALAFDCLPDSLDVQSLQVAADAAVRIGETAVRTEDRALSAACAASPLDGRIRELEDRRAALQAERDAQGLVTGYLKNLGGGDGLAPPGPQAIAATADMLRRTGQDALARQHQIARAQEDLERQLKPLLAERERAQGRTGKVVTVSVTLAATRDADVTLSYQVRGPGWTPAYRAVLDTASQRLRLERQALVAQATGEDWLGARLVLSTGQPLRATAGRVPPAWRVGLQPPPQARAEVQGFGSAPAPAPAPAMARGSAPVPEAPLFDVSVFQGSFATEFSVPQAIDVPSGGQRVAVALGQHEDAVQLAVRTSPRLEAAAYLVADFAVPPGVWPAGSLQLYRDGAFVGSTRWTPPQEARATLSFGIDELVRVQAEPERDNQGSGGFVGTRAERQVLRAYTVENRHRTPIALQVLEAAPVSVDEQVRITTRFTPQPAELEWRGQPGLAMWRQELPAGQSARFSADYTIGYPKDSQLQYR